MLEITKYIKDLLFLHDCVILPGFGGFVANYRSAEIDENRNVFLPPSKDIGFNRNLHLNDGLLINRLIEAEKMTYSEAQKSISFFVEDLWVRIHRGERVILEGLGAFYHDKRFILQFEPDRSANFLVESMGLGAFALPRLPKVQGGKSQPALDLSMVRSFFTARRVRYAAVGIPALVALSLFPFKADRDGNMQYSSMNPVEAVTEAAIVNTMSSSIVSSQSEFVQFEPKVELTEVQEAVESVAPGKYYLIAGSFTSLDNAQVLKEELKSRSYPAQIIKNKELFSVAINSFDNRLAADQFKKKVIAGNSKASCWILKK